MYKKISFNNIRGNIPTRFKKFLNDAECDGFIVAKAAVDGGVARIKIDDWQEYEDGLKELLSVFFVTVASSCFCGYFSRQNQTS